LLYKINNNENKHNSRYYLFYNFEIIFNTCLKFFIF